MSRARAVGGRAYDAPVPVLKPRRRWPARLARTVVAVGALLVALAVVESLTGWLSAAYRWLPHLHMRADAAQAWGAWATFGIAAVAAVFAYGQVKVARETREEQAQPNVVMYAESTPSHWQFLDIVLRNFGATPAYNVTVEITPEPRRSPDYEGAEVSKVAFPQLTKLLAPGQEIRTMWDFAVAREDYMRKLHDRYDRRQLTRSEFRERELRSRHEAIVRYEDSHGNKYEMRSTLDADLLRDTMKTTTYTVHDLTKRIEKQQKALEKIAEQLQNFSKEHKGIWVYPSDADAERQYWADYAEELRQRRAALNQRIREAQARNAGEQADPADDQESTNESGANSTDDGTAEQ